MSEPISGPEGIPEPRGAGAEVGRRVACGFLILSVVAAFAPMRRYVARLGRDEFVVWAAAVAWTLTLPLALVLTLRLVQRWLERRRGREAGGVADTRGSVDVSGLPSRGHDGHGGSRSASGARE